MQSLDIAQSRSHTAKWVDNPRNRAVMHDEPRRLIAERISHARKNSLRVGAAVFLQMEKIANWHGMMAISRLLNNEMEGWADLHACYLYRVLKTRLDAAEQDLGYNLSPICVTDCMLEFVHAIAIRDDAFANWLGMRLAESILGRSSNFSGWTGRSFEIFAMFLYSLLKNTSLNISPKLSASLGVYQSVLNSWQSESELHDAIVRACEFHWAETFDYDQIGHVGAFASAPYSLFPVEIVAIRRVRGDLGLSTPVVDHPLMNTLLANPPDSPPLVKDDVLDELIAAAQAEGAIGDPW